MRDNYPVAKLKDADDDMDDPKEANKYRYARNGDNYLCPFQCDVCHFRNIQLRNPQAGSVQDMNMLVAIR